MPNCFSIKHASCAKGHGSDSRYFLSGSHFYTVGITSASNFEVAVDKMSSNFVRDQSPQVSGTSRRGCHVKISSVGPERLPCGSANHH